MAAHIDGMLGHADLDPDLLTPGVTAAADERPVVDPEDALPRIVLGSVTARALCRVWSGRPVTVVDSPPGAGKSALIRDVVAHLVSRSEITVAVDAPTIGLLVVDEAYQVTFADVLSASAKAEQILLVGDPGQIGPTADSLQGGQWAAVVALDPLTGTDGLPAHAASAGGLRVMALPPPDLGARRGVAGCAGRGCGCWQLGGPVDVSASRPDQLMAGVRQPSEQ